MVSTKLDRVRWCVCLFVGVALASIAARADSLQISYTNSVETSAPGSTVDFEATLTAPSGNSATVFLVGDNYNVDSPLVLDDSSFVNNAPLSMNPGDTYSGILFSVFIPDGTALGDYNGFFEISGGSDSTSSDDLSGNVPFTVEVTPPSSVPEPQSAALLVSGASLLLALKRRLHARS